MKLAIRRIEILMSGSEGEYVPIRALQIQSVVQAEPRRDDGGRKRSYGSRFHGFRRRDSLWKGDAFQREVGSPNGRGTSLRALHAEKPSVRFKRLMERAGNGRNDLSSAHTGGRWTLDFAVR